MSKLKWLFALIAISLTAACGGGGGDDSITDTPTGGDEPIVRASAIEGQVADGYLVGATVFSDRNGNKKLDEGEPSTVTGANGKYKLEGENLDQHPIVVKVDANVIDEDTDSAVGKKYYLSTPAGKNAFISPLTTMVQQQMEQNPALSAEEAEKVVMTRTGAAEGISAFKNYVDPTESEDDYKNLHKVAQVVASTFGEMQETVESAATTAGYDIEEDLDALIQIVVDRVMERLADISVTVSEISAESFDPNTIAADLEDQIATEDPVAIDEEIAAAETPATVTSFKDVLDSGGSYGFWYDLWSGGQALFFNHMTLGTDGQLSDDDLEYDFDNLQWVPSYDDGEYYLTSEGWKIGSGGGDAGTITFNDDGTATWTRIVDGAKAKVSTVEVDLSGQEMGNFVGDIKPLVVDPQAAFPAGSKAWKYTMTDLTETFEVGIWKNVETDPDYNYVQDPFNWENAITTLPEMRTTFSRGSGDYVEFDNDMWMQFDAGFAYIFEGEYNGTKNLVEIGTWTSETINNQNVLMITISNQTRLKFDVEGIPFFIEWEDGKVKRGTFYPAGNIHTGSYDFNKTATEAIFNNFKVVKPQTL